MTEVRRLAMALPEVVELDHHGLSSFRVRGKIFATVPDDRHLRLMLSEEDIRARAGSNPEIFREFYWGRRLRCLVVDLRGADAEELSELLTDSWMRKAPATLAREFRTDIE